MAQDEMRLRLLKDNKIIGFEKKTPVDSVAKQLQTMHSYDGIKWESCADPFEWLDNQIIFDHYELGIKVGDDWWFEGDIFKNTVTDYIFVLKHDAYKWLVVDWEKLERIGNIHDNPELINQ